MSSCEQSPETIYGRDSDTIDAMIATACAEDGDRTVTLGRNPDNPDGAWMITRAILLPDDFSLVLDGCRVELAPGTRDNILRNAGAVGYMRVTPNRNIKVLGRGEMHHITVRGVESAGQAAVWIRGPLCDSSVTDIRCVKDGPKYKIDAPVERVEFDP